MQLRFYEFMNSASDSILYHPIPILRFINFSHLDLYDLYPIVSLQTKIA